MNNKLKNKSLTMSTFILSCLLFLNCQLRKEVEINKDLNVLPSTVLNLSNWKITIPFDANGKDESESGVAAETKQPELKDYTLSGYYFTNATNDGVVFKAHAGGAHTSGSGYPRCELREMVENGTKTAKWQSNSGKHTMEIDQAITFLPSHKKHVVAGQIHSTGDYDDVITCRLEDKKLFLSHNGAKGTMLTDNYVLGTRFKIKFVVENDEIRSYYNNSSKPIEVYPINFPDAYFKAGCYTQSASWGKNNNHNADASDYGQVVIYGLSVSHE